MITVRKLEKKDLDELVVIENEAFSIPWSKKSFEEAIDNTNARYLVITDSDVVCGYLGMWYGGDHSEITNVAIAKEYRGRGFSKLLLDAAEKLAKSENITRLFLEVRVSNDIAKNLYYSHGFSDMGIRKNFYERPVEDALVLRKSISQNDED